MSLSFDQYSIFDINKSIEPAVCGQHNLKFEIRKTTQSVIGLCRGLPFVLSVPSGSAETA
jgi:hypothetical protein